MILEHLAQAERHVAEGQEHVARQREIASQLHRDGHTEAAEEAGKLLAQFEEMQTLHVADRDRLLKELAENSN